jgi:hypothetical protein
MSILPKEWIPYIFWNISIQLFAKITKMFKFLTFFVRWVANNLSIPFWMVGHVHLTMNVYKDIYEILASFGMNFIVGIGFYLDWRENRKNQGE